MPWKVCEPMDERLKFIARLLDGDRMSSLCREFGISRKTGYKIRDRYNDCGLEALRDRSRRPYRQANQLPMQIEKLIVRLKQEKPTWGGALDMRSPAQLYRKSSRIYRGLPDLAYPLHDKTITVTTCCGIFNDCRRVPTNPLSCCRSFPQIPLSAESCGSPGAAWAMG